jgi:hypothetical protein
MKLSEPQKKVADDDHRFRVLVTGRRFGKTTLAMRELAYHARLPDQLCWYVAPSYRMAKQIAWQMIKKKLKDLRWIKHTNEAELTITLKNNSRICLRGTDHPDSLRGIGLNFLCMDECGDIEEFAWQEVLRPTLSDTKGRALFCGTPKGMNWFHTLYTMGQDKADYNEWSSYIYTTLDGGWVDSGEIENAKKDMDERTFRQEYMATFETWKGIIYYGFSPEHTVKQFEVPDDMSIYHIGMDFNLDPMSAVVSYIKDNVVYVFDEIQMFSSNTDEMVEEIHSRYKNKKIFVYPDPSAKARRTSSGRRTDLSILQNGGFITKAFSHHMPIRDRINSVNSKLCAASGIRGIFIHPKCKNLLNSLAKHSYQEGTSTPDKKEGYDHMTDALGYMISFLYPVKKYYEPKEISTFNVKVGVPHGRL